MNRIITLLLIIFSLAGYSQISYNFSAVSSAFTQNSGGTSIINSGADDALSATTNIGFTFQYGCVNYTQFKASSNGWLTFNTGVTGSNLTNNLTTSSDRPIVAPLWDDLQVGTGGSVNYLLTGAAPNRVLTIEWLNMEWNYGASGPVISFQVKLYETSNRIEFVYRQEANNVNSGSASIGLGGQTSGDFYSLNNTGTSPTASKLSETTSLNTKPANGQLYSWDPVLCTGTPTAGSAVASHTTSCGNSYSSTLSLSGAVNVCGTTYQWQSSSSLSGPYSNISGATSQTAAVTVTAVTYYRCLLSCSGNTAASTPVTCSYLATSCGICNLTSITLPYSQSNLTNCGNGNLVTSAGVNNICGSSSYYGGEEAVYSFVPSSSGAIDINVASSGSYIGLMLYQGCPISGGTCAGYIQGSAGSKSLCVNVTAGQTYYLIVDSWPSPTCNTFDLSISDVSSCPGSISNAIASSSPATGCTPLTTTLSLSNINRCGVSSYQWQSSTSSTGPFNNITGATNFSYTASSLTVTTYYQCRLVCGTNTVFSSVATASVVTSTPTVPCSLNTYVASSVTFSFETFTGSTFPTTDDVLYNSILLFGFPFCYAGQQFTGGYAASNSALVFPALYCTPNIQTTTYAAPGVWTGYSISQGAPVNGTSIPRNAILAPWHDILPSVGSPTLQCATLGVAPNRRFILSWENVPMYSCSTSSPSIYYSGQIKLFETTNDIEIHIKNKGVCPGWNNGQAVMGLHNHNGTIYVPPVNNTAHNATASNPYNQWTMTNTAYRFSSSCPANDICSVQLPILFKNFYGQNIDNVNKIWWETSNENKVLDFAIERSLDGITFEEVGRQAAFSHAGKHLFDDYNYKKGHINYYRITAYEKNGYTTTTPTYPVYDYQKDFVIASVYPNPAQTTLSVDMSSFTNTDCHFTIYDTYGRTLMKTTEFKTIGMSVSTINVETLSPGMYILEVKTSGNNTIIKHKFTRQ